jgi:hypothetical protein
MITELVLDNVSGLTIHDINKTLRSNPAMKSLAHFSIRFNKSSITCCPLLAKVLSTMPSLTSLDISGCKIENRNSIITDGDAKSGSNEFQNVFQLMSQIVIKLAKLVCQNCPGLDDFSLIGIGDMIAKNRKLSYIDLSKCVDFSDEGLLQMVLQGPNVISTLKLVGCRSITNLGLVGLRNKMSVLTVLDVSCLLITQVRMNDISLFDLFAIILKHKRNRSISFYIFSSFNFVFFFFKHNYYLTNNE